MPAQTGYFDTLKSVAGKVFTYLASITLTGTDGKIITCTQNTALDEAVAMSSKAPKASPSFTVGIGIGGVAAGLGGIAFPAAAVAVADVNTLDDYEEGTWTPAVGGNATYHGQTGFYTKIGRVVFFEGEMVINVLGTGSVSTISGLPFTSKSGGISVFPVYFGDLAVNMINVVGMVDPNATTIKFYGMAAAGGGMGANINLFGNATQVDFSGHYII